MSNQIKIRTYTPEGYKGYEYVKERNENLARYLARIYHTDYLSPQSEFENDSYLLFNSHVDLKTYNNLNKPDFYGGVSDGLYVLKTIFHEPLKNSLLVPQKFPVEFSKWLSNRGLVLPGFSVFSYEELEEAYLILSVENKYVARIKNPASANGEGHTVIRSDEDLKRFINESKTVLNISHNGLVIEANIKQPTTFSIGSSKLFDETYFYIGEQLFKWVKNQYLYSGTRLFMAEQLGDLNTIKFASKDDLISMLKEILRHLHLIPDLLATRQNFDVIYGEIERLDGKQSSPGYYFLEQSFRPGGASGAEFKAIDKIKNQNLKVAQGECIVTRDTNAVLKPDSLDLYTGIDSHYGYLNISAF